MTPLEKISQFLHRRFGWGFSHPVMTSLGHAVAGRMDVLGLQVMDDYWQLLGKSDSEVSQLVEASVVRETFFFRYPESFTALSKWALERPGKRLRILSMACSTGEEPYTIAMHLLDSGVAFDLEARDLSPVAIATAQRGVYTANAFRSPDLSWRERYFQETDGHWQISESLRSHVHFRQGNLLEIEETAAWDVIFCRNVMIYFSTDKQQAALDRLRRALVDDGLLFLGPAEPPVLLHFGWFPFNQPMSFCCTKRNLSSSSVRMPFHGAVTLPVAAPKKEPAKAVKPAPVVLPPQPAPPVRSELERAQALADAGQFDEAMDLLETARKTDTENAEIYFLQGVISEARGRHRDAEMHYRRTLFINSTHEGALQHMTLLLRSEGRNRAADNLSRRASRHSP